MRTGLRYKGADKTYLDLFADTITVSGEINADDGYIVTGKIKWVSLCLGNHCKCRVRQ